MPPTAISKNRKALSLKDKIQLLDYYKETKCSIRKLAKHFNIGKTQAGLIIKQEKILYELWLSGSPGIARKRLSSAGFEIDKKMYDWYLEKKKENQDVTGPALQKKALELASDLGYDSFKASNGWLAKFVKRHSISFKEFKNQGPSNSEDKQITSNLSFDFDEWSRILSLVIDKYSEDCIYSAIQTGLFFRTAPDDTSFLLEKSCAGGTFSAERLTVLFCTSMSGLKEKPLVVADISEKEIENLTSVEVDCKSNSFAWLTKNIMNEWLTGLDNKMKEQKKNIVLFLDYSLPCHDCQLSNIRTIHFPILSPNNQRINQGIVRNFKVVYRLQVLEHLIAVKEKYSNDPLPNCAISVPQALMWVHFSWKELSENVIHKCFEEIFFNVACDSVCDEESAVTLNDVSDLLCAYDSATNAADYVSIDDCLVTEGEDAKSVEILVDVDDIYADSDEENFNESETVIPNNGISNFYYESLKGLKHLEQFYLSQNDSNGAVLVKQLIVHHENLINSKATQS